MDNNNQTNITPYVDFINTEEEKIFKDENYCLRLYFQGLMDIDLLSDGILNIEKKKNYKN